MANVSVRDLRNHGGEVLARVQAGEHVIVTRDGEPVAELTPLRSQALDATTLLRRWQHLPKVDPTAFRADIDALIDQDWP